jgi:hypothetical protein
MDEDELLAGSASIKPAMRRIAVDLYNHKN